MSKWNLTQPVECSVNMNIEGALVEIFLINFFIEG